MAAAGAIVKESAAAQRAYADYVNLGDGRSLEQLADLYRTCPEPAPPTKHLTTLKLWSRTYGWQARIKKLADAAVADAEAAYEARRREILTTGLALDHERVAVLKEIAEDLVDDFEPWVETVKLAANGAKVPVEEFNAAELRELRGVLDDIAKETGGRQTKVEHTGKDGGPIRVSHRAEDLSDDDLARIASGG